MVTLNPSWVGNRVQPMRAVEGNGQAPPNMANRAFHDNPRISLQAERGHIVVGDIGPLVRFDRPLGMSAAMTGFTINPGMIVLAQPIKNLLAVNFILCKTPVGGDDRSGIGIIGSIRAQQADSVCPADDIRVGSQVVQHVAGMAGLTTGFMRPGDRRAQDLRPAYSGSVGKQPVSGSGDLSRVWRRAGG